MINFSVEKNKKLQQKLILLIFFISLFVVGSSIFHYYGISFDEEESAMDVAILKAIRHFQYGES